MAAKPLPRLARWLGRALAVLAALVGLFFLAGWIGSSIPRNSGWTEPAEGVEIMVETNGTHTGIVMPVVTPQKDWRQTFPTAGQYRSDGQMPTHVAIGWGEREIFLNTPTWGDLKPSTALRIGFLGGDAVMRVSHYVRPAPSEDYRPLTISPQQYDMLVHEIEASLQPVPPGRTDRAILRGTDPRDAYYDARGRWTIGNTCNTWVGDTLAGAGVEMGRFTPFPGGVMKWIARPSAPTR